MAVTTRTATTADKTRVVRRRRERATIVSNGGPDADGSRPASLASRSCSSDMVRTPLVEQRSKGQPSARQSRLHRASRDAECARNLLDRQIEQVMHDNDLALTDRQQCECSGDIDAIT